MADELGGPVLGSEKGGLAPNREAKIVAKITGREVPVPLFQPRIPKQIKRAKSQGGNSPAQAL